MSKENEKLWHLKQSKTTALVAAEHEDPNVFACVIKFPNGRIMQMSSKPIKPEQNISADAYKHYSDKVVAYLLAKNDDESIRQTNWVSFMAAMQKLIIDWNQKRTKALEVLTAIKAM